MSLFQYREFERKRNAHPYIETRSERNYAYYKYSLMNF